MTERAANEQLFSRWMSEEDCAAYLRCKPRTFRERTAVQPGFPSPSKVVGAGKLWDRFEIDAYIAKQKINRAA